MFLQKCFLLLNIATFVYSQFSPEPPNAPPNTPPLPPNLPSPDFPPESPPLPLSPPPPPYPPSPPRFPPFVVSNDSTTFASLLMILLLVSTLPIITFGFINFLKYNFTKIYFKREAKRNEKETSSTILVRRIEKVTLKKPGRCQKKINI